MKGLPLRCCNSASLVEKLDFSMQTVGQCIRFGAGPQYRNVCDLRSSRARGDYRAVTKLSVWSRLLRSLDVVRKTLKFQEIPKAKSQLCRRHHFHSEKDKRL